MFMRDYYDLIVFEKNVSDKLLKLGFKDTGFEKFKILNNPSKYDKRKINLFVAKNKQDIIKITRKYRKYILGFINPILEDKTLINPGMMRIIKDANMCLVFTLNFMKDFKNKQKLFRDLKFIGKLSVKYKVPIIISSGAATIFDIKTPRQLASLGLLFGFNYMQCLNTISTNYKYLVDLYESYL